MSKYKVIEVSAVTTTPTGKKVKKLTLSGEGQNHLEKRVSFC